MAFVTAPDGVRLSYATEGNGPPLVLHLGAGCDAELWRAAGYIDVLAARYRCILFDYRGHGLSDRPRGWQSFTIDRLVDDVVALLDHLGIDAAGFWGYSAGMGVGLKLAEGHPDRLRALIGSGALGPDTPDDLAAWVSDQVPRFRADGWEHLLVRFDEQEGEPIPDWMKDRIRATDVQQFIDSLEAETKSFWDAWASLRSVATPTLLLAGALEDPDDLTSAAADRMPNARRVRLDGLGHINAFLRSDLALTAALPFLAHHLGGPAAA